MKDEKKERKPENEPIIDGDARPDSPMNLDDESLLSERKKSKTTANRADRNSLEDFKDAKTE